VELVVDLRAFGRSAPPADIEVPKGRATDELAMGIPITYVPVRKTVLLSLALAWAESLGASDIFIGVDNSGYPGCLPEYITSFESMANLATRAGVESKGRFRIHAPLIAMNQEQIIERGKAHGVDFGLTNSCYDPDSDGGSCGRGDACSIRLTAFAKLRLTDPVRYVSASAGG
jgi:7-cyano-7-deazaguanine synthase